MIGKVKNLNIELKYFSNWASFMGNPVYPAIAIHIFIKISWSNNISKKASALNEQNQHSTTVQLYSHIRLTTMIEEGGLFLLSAVKKV